eukprot:351328-Chlamydomonas_euryale.AAC.4
MPALALPGRKGCMWGSVRACTHASVCVCVYVCTEIVVRVDGEVERSFTVKAGVRQGRVIAPTLFDVEHILQGALSQLRVDKHLGKLQPIRAVHCQQMLSHNVTLTYADELAYFGTQTFHERSEDGDHGGRPMALPTFKLSGEELMAIDVCKALGVFLADGG